MDGWDRFPPTGSYAARDASGELAFYYDVDDEGEIVIAGHYVGIAPPTVRLDRSEADWIRRQRIAANRPRDMTFTVPESEIGWQAVAKQDWTVIQAHRDNLSAIGVDDAWRARTWEEFMATWQP